MGMAKLNDASCKPAKWTARMTHSLRLSPFASNSGLPEFPTRVSHVCWEATWVQPSVICSQVQSSAWQGLQDGRRQLQNKEHAQGRTWRSHVDVYCSDADSTSTGYPTVTSCLSTDEPGMHAPGGGRALIPIQPVLRPTGSSNVMIARSQLRKSDKYSAI